MVDWMQVLPGIGRAVLHPLCAARLPGFVPQLPYCRLKGVMRKSCGSALVTTAQRQPAC